MAIAGGATVAYKFSIKGSMLRQLGTTFPAYMCDSPEEAVAKLRSGQPAIVAGGETMEFNKLWAKRKVTRLDLFERWMFGREFSG